jgi:hypothetical protein
MRLYVHVKINSTKYLRQLEHGGILGSNPTLGMEVCLHCPV